MLESKPKVRAKLVIPMSSFITELQRRSITELRQAWEQRIQPLAEIGLTGPPQYTTKTQYYVLTAYDEQKGLVICCEAFLGEAHERDRVKASMEAVEKMLAMAKDRGIEVHEGRYIPV